MSEEIKHSPTPWKFLDGMTNSKGENLGGIESAEGLYVAEVCPDSSLKYDDNHAANAAHIVKCVNLHDELVEALQELLGAARHCGLQHGIDFDHFWETAATQAKNTITKATK